MGSMYLFIGVDDSVSVVYDAYTLTDDKRKDAIEVDELPDMLDGVGVENQVLMFNRDTDTLYWRYIEPVFIEEEQIYDL